jgi:hypothetical protein
LKNWPQARLEIQNPAACDQHATGLSVNSKLLKGTMTNLHEITANRNEAHRRACHNQLQWRRPRRHRTVEASISVSAYGDCFGVVFIIYGVGAQPKREFFLLKPGECLNGQRAWLVGYQRVCAWLDEHAPNARLYIIPADERRARRRAA